MKRILIIDDDNDTCETYSLLIDEYFDDDQVECETFVDANKALARVMSNNFDLAIVDLNLKNSSFNGVDIAKECIIACKPVIICSGSNLIFKIKSYLDLKKFNNYVVFLDKPLNVDELHETLDHLLNIKINRGVVCSKIMQH